MKNDRVAPAFRRAQTSTSMTCPVLVDRPYGVGPLAGDLDVGVGSGRGAVSVFRLIGFLGPPAEPDVSVPEHPALHKSLPLGQAAVVVAVHGRGILAPR